MRNFIPFVIISCSLALATPSRSQHLSIFELFEQHRDTIPVVKLDTDWGELIQHKMGEEFQDGLLSFNQTDGKTIQLNIKLRARGNIRKQVCLYPPIKIKIPKKQLDGLGLKDTFNNLKLILTCREGGQYEEFLLKEALAYRLYEIVSPVHFKTRLLKMEGWDGAKEKFNFFALLIEDDTELMNRLNAKEVSTETVKIHTLDRESYLKMTFFEYMIANVDWAIHNKHNVSMFLIPGYSKAVPIAYDFDYSGFVGTNYAVPHESVPITSVSQRHFMGQFVTEEEAMATAAYFLTKKEEVLKACAEYKALNEKDRKSLEKFLDKFFCVLDSKKQIKREFVTKR